MSKPIKRHQSLQPLSREHHHGLLFCWKIREGFKRDIAPKRMKEYADWFWKTHLSGHFKTEEKYVFCILPAENSSIKKAVADHRRLKSFFENDKDSVVRLLTLIEEELDKHIRFEERDLFNEIQQFATEEQLQIIEAHHGKPFIDNWKDEFWK